jgi:hypothetical protein
MSKGSTRRKSQVTCDEFQNNWDNIFGKKIPNEAPVKDEDIFYDELRKEIEAGDIVCKKNGSYLRGGAEVYHYGIVICIEPFILCSADSDMRWSSTITKEEFRVVGKASQARLTKCLKRL